MLQTRTETESLVFVDDSQPGITRCAVEGGWAYFDPDGNRITNEDLIRRLASVALPPAYRDAWYGFSQSGRGCRSLLEGEP